ncbi:MAG TPA: site-specific integrase, partial [Candidatus Scatomorpha gallistercoris]|nr:site-specific integrase [Candidatus Scatomorpha gallistercoris]
EEVQKLFKYLPHDKTGDSIRLLLLTGMRSQELLALEARHIEPDGSCIHIRQAVKQVKGTVFVGATKSATSVRDVPIPVAYRDMVKRLRTYCTPYLWTGKGGNKPCNPTHFRDKFAAAIESVPGVRPLTPHSCRHTFATLMKRVQGADKDKLELIGHTSTDMLRHYQDVDFSDLRRITDAI